MKILKPIFENIPAELTASPQWLMWRAVPKPNGRTDKLPHSPQTGQICDATDPQAWGSFEQARAAYKRGGFDGVGFALADGGITGVDLDDCVTDGVIQMWAYEIIEQLDTYTEYSPSGNGLRLFISGKIPGPRRRKGKIEMYEAGRFLTVTGHRVKGTPGGVQARQTELDALYTQTYGNEPQTAPQPTSGGVDLPDDELIRRATAAANGAKFAALWRGDTTGYDSASEADLALSSLLAYWSGKNSEQMDRLFRRSGLYREKWDRQDYRDRTVTAAIRSCTETHNPSLRPGDQTDVGQAQVLAREYGDWMRYSAATDFLVYDGTVWHEDGLKAHGLAQELTERQLKEARAALRQARAAEDQAATAGDEHAHREARATVRAAKAYRTYVLSRRASGKIAASLRELQPILPIDVAELDADPYLLNTPGGTVDLRGGATQPHRPDDYCTKITAVAPGNEGAEIWADFLGVITCNDRDLEHYLQTVAGMALVGKVFAELLIIAYGGGRNGKSTFFGALARVLGTYAGGLSADVLTVDNRRNKSPELAELRGRRLVIAAELEEGRRLDVAAVKRIASTDTIRGEPKYKAPFDFTPTHSTVLHTNHLPKVGASDNGTWRRLVVVPFNAVIQGDADIKNYADYLFTHAGGAVLQWAIEGAARFIAGGHKINPPECVKRAISEYRNQNDWLAHFLAERCEVNPRYTQRAGDLYTEYRSYCLGTGEYTRSAADFRAALLAAGYETRRTMHGAMYHGLRLRPEFAQWAQNTGVAGV